MLPEIWDFIVVGGGLAGCVISSRLHEYNSSLNILLIEAGTDLRNNSIIPYANNTLGLSGTALDWQYSSTSQPALGGRKMELSAGKGLGGGTAINYSAWVRGTADAYDEWAELVDDQRWSYDGLLPYFKKVERVWENAHANHKQHGFVGPISTASIRSTGRNYPLRETARDAWNEIRLRTIADGNDGSPVGVAEVVENRRNGLRELSCNAYSQDGVTVMTDSLVKRILTDSKNGEVAATGVELANGSIFKAAQEVIISAGAYRSAQILLLSGIGPTEELEKHGIQQVVNSPDVGQGLRNHLALTQFWKLSNPDAHQAIGSPNPLFQEPQFNTGLPTDWVTVMSVDDKSVGNANKASTASRKDYVEALMVYAAGNSANPVVPLDGSHILTFVIGMRPTSAGSLRLNSTDPSEFPLLDPAYYSTETDRNTFRTGARTLAKALLNTSAGKSFIASETVANGFAPILHNSTDGEIDARVQAFAGNGGHPHGSVEMGKVVDTELRVIGVRNLRVADASVFPTAITGHLQQATYATAEQAVDMIMAAFQKKLKR